MPTAVDLLHQLAATPLPDAVCVGERDVFDGSTDTPSYAAAGCRGSGISALLSGLVKQGELVRDVAALVDRLKRPRKKLATFTEDEVRTLLKHVADDRLAHAWHLALSGLRRGELCGLRWSDVDLAAGTITVTHTGCRSTVNPWIRHPRPTGRRGHCR
jgi:integrase